MVKIFFLTDQSSCCRSCRLRSVSKMPRSHFYRRSYGFRRRKSSRGGFKRRKVYPDKSNFSAYPFRPHPNQTSTKIRGQVSLPPSLGAYPKSVRVCLPFTETATVTTAAGVGCWYRWRANSVFDPDLTGSGTQPYGYDQWSNFYKQWFVSGSSIEVMVVNTGGGTADSTCIKVVVWPSSSSALAITSAALDTVEEFPDARMRIISSMATAGSSTNTIRHYMPTAKIEGMAPVSIASDHLYWGTQTSDCSNVTLWNVGVNNMLENGSYTYYIHVKIRYYVTFFTPWLTTGS